MSIVLFDVLLPLPPSTNHLYRSAHRRGTCIRVKTREALAWQRDAGYALLAATTREAREWATSGPLSVEIELRLATARRRDVDNLKLVLDTVCAALGVDDARVERLVVEKRWVPRGQEGCAVRVVLEEIEEGHA